MGGISLLARQLPKKLLQRLPPILSISGPPIVSGHVAEDSNLAGSNPLR
jgi:hypothetical protein